MRKYWSEQEDFEPLEIAGLFSSFQVNVPQLYAEIDRTKARQLGVAVTDVFETMQIYPGSMYVNDFNKFGRTYSVSVQADAKYRNTPCRWRRSRLSKRFRCRIHD
jgi:multidrug efflux pump